MAAVSKEEYAARRKAWIEALRSGKYKQGVACLGNNAAGFCCLGVGCIVAGIPFAPENLSSTHFADWVGLRDVEGDYRGNTLTCRNDKGEPFDSLAAFIESNPPGLFREDTL